MFLRQDKVFLRQFFSLITSNKGLFSLILLLEAVTDKIFVIFNLFLTLALSALTAGNPISVLYLSVIFFLIFVSNLLLKLLLLRLKTIYSYRLRKSLSSALIISFWNGSDYRILREGATDLLGQLKEDIERMVSATSSFFSLSAEASEIVIMVIILLIFSPLMLLIVLAISVLSFFLSLLPSRRFGSLGQQISTLQQRYISKIQDLFKGLHLFLFRGKEGNIKERLSLISLTSLAKIVRLRFKTELIQTSLIIPVLGVTFLTTFVVGILTYQGYIDLPAFLLFGSYSGFIQARLQSISQNISMILVTKELFNRLDLRQSQQIDLIDLDGFTSIKLNDLCLSFDKKIVIKNLNLTFERGKKYAIVGPSGVGKTSLAYLLLGFLKPTSGSLIYLKEDLSQQELGKSKGWIGLLSSQHELLNVSLRENLLLGRDGEITSERLEAVLREVNLTSLIKKIDEEGVISRLSTGQKQRLLLARFLLNPRAILILDEALANLDHKNRRELEQRLLKDPNITLIHITHHLDRDLKYDKIHDFALIGRGDEIKA